MKLIKQSHKVIPQEPGLEGIYKMIELAGRLGYKSKSKIKEGSADKFVKKLIAARHYSVLEHGTVYLLFPYKAPDVSGYKYTHNKYSKMEVDRLTGDLCITTNYRVLVENGWVGDLQYLCEPTLHQRRTSVHIITNRGVTHELVRHRSASYSSPESTKWCNYSKNKFGSELTFILPVWMAEQSNFMFRDLDAAAYGISMVGNNKDPNYIFILSLEQAEISYFRLLELGWAPEQVRDVLPQATKTEILVTADEDEWRVIFKQRTAQDAHPQMKALMQPLLDEFQKLSPETYNDIIY